MGADLYIKSITEPARKKYEPRFNKACAARDAHIEQRQRLEQVLATFKNSGATSLPSIAKQAKGIRQLLETIKAQIVAAQKEVERYYSLMNGRGGYFRDSYNGSSVLWRLGLSWWKDCKGGTMKSKDLADFAVRVEKAKLEPVTAEELKEMGCKVDDGENSPAVWNKHFRNKKRRLVWFLKRAARHAALGEEVYFSL